MENTYEMKKFIMENKRYIGAEEHWTKFREKRRAKKGTVFSVADIGGM